MKVFVVNCGSSSIKYQLFDMADETVLAKGLLERVGQVDAQLHHAADGQSIDRGVCAPDPVAGINLILEALVDGKTGVIKSIDQIDAVGHRVVHGGEKIHQPMLIDEEVIGVIRDNFQVSPLHNPPNLAGIEGARAAMSDVPQVAVFDTAFLSTLPPKAFRYAVPGRWYQDYHVRKYGFHGTSHRYVTLQTARLLGKCVDEVNLITVHLGNGCSMTAVAGGKAVDHSMGMTPLEGLVMGTRSGDIDPGIVFYMQAQGMSYAEVDRALNKESGLLGLSECSNDMRDLLEAIDRGDRKARLAVDVFVYRIVKYIGAYYTILPALDAVVFTGGIGENSAPVRREICRLLHRLGAKLDERANEATVKGNAGPITTAGSPLAVWVVPTNEELMIAHDTESVVSAKKP